MFDHTLDLNPDREIEIDLDPRFQTHAQSAATAQLSEN